MKAFNSVLNIIRKIRTAAYLIHPMKSMWGGDLPKWYDAGSAQYYGQGANDYVREAIERALLDRKPLLISKFGIVELSAVTFCKRSINGGLKMTDYIDYTNCIGDVFGENCLDKLYMQAGFFPKSMEMMYKFSNLVINDIKEIDILGSYCKSEKYLKNELSSCIKIDIDGYLAPFLWEHPWSRVLEGKRVLVIYPFTESIISQYENVRKYLFKDPTVLPEFEELTCIKAVQSIAGNKTGFKTWFDALDYMKKEIDKVEFDVALIGCGAYGMCLGAHIKRRGKIAVHLAGWTQNLFGIYGNRWINDMPQYMKYVNKYWKRPMESEKPLNAEKVENACYW